jgi:hypothetical protein
MSGLKRTGLIIALISLIVASCFLWMGLRHNPQGEFYGSESGTNWAAIGYLFFGWFASSFVALWIVMLLGAAFLHSARAGG